MDKKQLPVITISRLYGAGGHSVAKGLSEKLGLKYYDMDFIRLTAKVSGYSESEIKKEGEDLGDGARFINRFFTTASFSNPYDEIFQAQKAVILGLAKEPCIIVGRCSNIILQEAGIPSFDVFLSASWEYRLKRAAELAENDGMDLERYVERRDHWRRTYYKAYTDHEYGFAGDY
ncbi:MAG: cytidylate kinase-like family protein, partial [Lachnospiraceae bacterium]|nr:cytidylate kinase-like family protein [Lachnospiraceae bacterium]